MVGSSGSQETYEELNKKLPVNPHLIKNFGNNSLRMVKSDPADARKIARYTLDNWTELRQYSGALIIKSGRRFPEIAPARVPSTHPGIATHLSLIHI